MESLDNAVLVGDMGVSREKWRVALTQTSLTLYRLALWTLAKTIMYVMFMATAFVVMTTNYDKRVCQTGTLNSQAVFW